MCYIYCYCGHTDKCDCGPIEGKPYIRVPKCNKMDQFLKPGASYRRLEEEYYKYGTLAIAYDFDATVHDFHKTGESHEQVKQLIRDLSGIDCKVYCWTAHPDLLYVRKYLGQENIPCDGINCDSYIPLFWASRKPFYSALLDDRAGLKQVFEDLELLVYTVKQGVKDVQRESSEDNHLPTSEERGEVQSSQSL